MLEPLSLATISFASIGAALGMVGGAFNSFSHNNHKLIAFAIWEVSNGILAYWAWSVGEYTLMGMYLFFICTSTIGFYNHWMVKKNGDDTKC
jgi:hypothetical protein